MSERAPRRGRRRRWLWLWLLLVLLAAPLAAGMWMVTRLAADQTLLRAAEARLEAGELEAAQQQLAPLRRRLLLPLSTRRGAARLYLRLGEDRTAHTLLKGLTYARGRTSDRELRALSDQCLRASALLQRADRLRDPRARLRLARLAHRELPEAPSVLRRVVEEELLSLTRKHDPELALAFAEDYARLRRAAPSHAAAVRQRAQEALKGGGQQLQ